VVASTDAPARPATKGIRTSKCNRFIGLGLLPAAVAPADTLRIAF
jgi:hypothetical protein